MLQSSVTQKVLYVLHIIILLSALGLLYFSVYYSLKLEEFVNLRDQNKKASDNGIGIYLLPWVYFTIGLFALINSAIGLLSTKLYNQSTALCMTISSGIFITAALTMALTTNLLTAGEMDSYIENAAVEIVRNRRMGIYEKWFTCCGATGEQDYDHNAVSKFCCDHTDSPCTSQEANLRVGCTEMIQRYVHVVNWALFSLAMVICAWALGSKGVALKTYFKKKRQQEQLTSSTLYGIAGGQKKMPDQTSC